MGAHASDTASTLDALRKIVRFLRLADRHAEAATGLSAAQLYVLHALADAPIGSLAELAERTLTDPSSVSAVCTKLVKRGLAVQTATTADRRRKILRLTRAGERLVRKSPPLVQSRIVDGLATMPTAQRSQLARGLERFVVAIGADALPARLFFEDEQSQRPRGKRRG